MSRKTYLGLVALAAFALLVGRTHAQYIKLSEWASHSDCPSSAPDMVIWSPASQSCPGNIGCVSPTNTYSLTVDCTVQPVTVPGGAEYVLLRINTGGSCSGAAEKYFAFRTGVCVINNQQYIRVSRTAGAIVVLGCSAVGCTGTCVPVNYDAGVCNSGTTATIYQDSVLYSVSGNGTLPTSIPLVSIDLSGGATTAPAARQAAPSSLPAGTRGYSVDQLWTADQCTLSDQPPDTLVFRQADACTGVACSSNAYPYTSTQTACATDGTAPTDATYAVKAYAFFDKTRQCNNPLFAEMYRVNKCVSNVDRSAYVIFSCNATDVTVVSYDPDDTNCTGTTPYSGAASASFVANYCDTANNVAYSCSEAGSATAKFYASDALTLASSGWAAAVAVVLAAAWTLL